LSKSYSLILVSIGFVILLLSVSAIAYASMSPALTVKKTPFWAGYGDTVSTTTGGITGIFASFIQPGISCNSFLGSSQEVRFLAGIDGSPAGVSDYAYIGTDVTCGVGSVTPFYKTVTSALGLPPLVIKPGNRIFASITESSGIFFFNITDVTTGKSSTTNSSAARAFRISGECIVSSVARIPLAKFSIAEFGQDYTRVLNTCYTRIGSMNPSPVGTPPVGAVIVYVMYNFALTSIRASPSALTPDHSSFKVMWVSYGP
jgi:hypothetical protein